MTRCERCGRNTRGITILSWFKREVICAAGESSCRAREREIRDKLRRAGVVHEMEGCGFVPSAWDGTLPPEGGNS